MKIVYEKKEERESEKKVSDLGVIEEILYTPEIPLPA